MGEKQSGVPDSVLGLLLVICVGMFAFGACAGHYFWPKANDAAPPEIKRTAEEQQAYDYGKKSRRAGIDRANNPFSYSSQTNLNHQWIFGWAEEALAIADEANAEVARAKEWGRQARLEGLTKFKNPHKWFGDDTRKYDAWADGWLEQDKLIFAEQAGIGGGK